MKTFLDLSKAARVGLVLVVVLAVCLVPSVVLAQAPPAAAIKPPVPTSPDSPPLIWNYLVFALVALMVLGSGLVPSKRGHQD